jgi:hypothetical protein
MYFHPFSKWMWETTFNPITLHLPYQFLFNYTTHWWWLLPTILAFITPKGDVGFSPPMKGDLRFYTIPCRHSRFHHMWRKSSITHLFVVICHQFGFHHVGRKCLSMHLLGVICSTLTIHDRNVQPHYCLTSFVSNFQPPPKEMFVYIVVWYHLPLVQLSLV